MVKNREKNDKNHNSKVVLININAFLSIICPQSKQENVDVDGLEK